MVSEEILCRGCYQLTNKPTRDVGGSSAAALDHIYVSHAKYVEKIHNISIIHTDHNLIGANLDLINPVFESQTFRTKKGDFIYLLMSTEWRKFTIITI